MILFWQNHRLGQKPTFVFENAPETMTGGLESFDAKAAKSEFLKWTEAHQADSAELEKAADEWVEEKYGPEAYRQALTKELPNIPEKMINESVQGYAAGFPTLKAEFVNSVKNRNSDYKKRLEKTMEGSQDLQKELKKAIGKENKVAEKAAELDQAIAKSDAVDLKSTDKLKDETEEALIEGLIPALNDKYFNLDWQEKILKDDEFSEYKSLARDFKDNMREIAKGRLELLFRNATDPGLLKTDLEGLRDEIKGVYEKSSKQSGSMDYKVLKEFAEKASKGKDFSRALAKAENKEEILAIMEAKDFFARKESVEASRGVAESIIRRVEREGADEKFIIAVNKYIKQEKGVTNFDDAKSVFERELRIQTEGSFRKGFDLAEQVSTEVFKDLQEAKGLETQRPAFKSMVDAERNNFLGGRTKPGNVDDIRLLAFMKLNTREEQVAALTNPTKSAELFQSIKTILNRQEGKEGKEWKDRFPKKGEKLRTGYDVEHPTSHDLLARHLAIVGLAKEAEFVITNLATTKDLKDSGIGGLYEKADANKTPAPTDYKFKDNFKRSKGRYVSEAERAGFNRRDIGFAILQTWGMITFLLNAKESWSGLDKIPEMLGKMAQNPFIYLGGGAVLGPHALKKDPESLGYLTQSRGGQERIVEHWKLKSLSEEVGYTSLKNFLGNGDEIAAMKNMMEKDPKRDGLKKAMAMADKRSSEESLKTFSWQKPGLRMGDLETAIDKKEPDKLTPSPNKSQDRIRYLFYSKFLTDKSVNLEQLIANCKNWQGT